MVDAQHRKLFPLLGSQEPRKRIEGAWPQYLLQVKTHNNLISFHQPPITPVNVPSLQQCHGLNIVLLT